MAFIQAVRPGGWGKFSTPAVINKTNIIGSFNNSYGGGFGVGMPMYGGGMMMGGCTMDYGCCGGGMKPFWGGFLGGFLGGILNFFGGGGGGSRVSDSSAVYSYQQGPGGPGAPGASGEDPAAKLKEFLGEDYSVMYDNGKYTVRTPDDKILTGKSTDDIISQLKGGSPATKQATLTGDGRETALKELREEATKFNSDNGQDGFALSVNDNPTGDKTKGTDLQYTLTYTDSKGNTHTSEFKTVPTPGELKQFKDGIEAKITGGAAPVDNPGGAGGDGSEIQDDGGRGKQTVPSGTNEAFEKIFGKGVLPEGCEAVTDGAGKFQGVKYNGKVYTTPDDLMKAINGFDLVSSDGFDLNSLKDKTFDIIDHGDISDIGNVKASDITGDTIKIGNHTYKVIKTDDEGHVYLQATDNTRQTEVYILEQGTDKFRLSQYKYTESGQTRGQGKAGYAGWGEDID